MSHRGSEVLVHVGAGIGNVVLATPLFVALHEMGFTIDVWLTGDYEQLPDLLRSLPSVGRITAISPMTSKTSRWSALRMTYGGITASEFSSAPTP